MCSHPHEKRCTHIAPGEAVESTLRMLKSGGTCSAFRSPWQQRITRLSDYQTIKVDYKETISRLPGYLIFVIFGVYTVYV